MVPILRVGMARLVGMAVFGLILMLLECALLCGGCSDLFGCIRLFFVISIASLVFAGLPRSFAIDHHAH